MNSWCVGSILITNDDGNTPLLRLTAEIVANIAKRVTIVAPNGDRTGCSAAISLNTPIEVRAIENTEGSAEWWMISSFPADGVRYAMRRICPDAELVFSGINNGWNLGYSVINSGTVGAALEGARFGRSGISVSVAFAMDEFNAEWKQCAEEALRTLLTLPELRSCGPLVLNVSLPAVFRNGQPTFRILPLSSVQYEEWYEGDGNGGDIIVLRGQRMIPDPIVPDLEELAAGFVIVNVIETSWAKDLKCLRAALLRLAGDYKK